MEKRRDIDGDEEGEIFAPAASKGYGSNSRWGRFGSASPRIAALAIVLLGLPLQGIGSAAAETVSSARNVPPRAPAAELPAIEAERARLFDEMMRDPSNLDIAFRYAELSSRSGDLEGAAATLERMLIFSPGLPRLQLELGVIYFRLGAYDTAKSYFDQALAAPDVPPEVKAKVAPYLVSIADKGMTERFSGSVTTGLRYQSNANAAPETRSIRTTLLADPLLLDSAAIGASDVNGFIAGNFQYSRDLEGQGDRFEASLQTYGALYAERDELNTGFAELTVGPSFNLERFSIEDAYLGLYGILGGVTLKDDPYLVSGGAGISFVKLLSPATRMTLRGEYRAESFKDSDLRPTASQRDGTRIRGQIGLQHQWNSQLLLYTNLSAEHREADRDYLSYTEGGITIGGTYSFASPFPRQAEPWLVGLNAGYIKREYDKNDPVFSRTEAEDDDERFVEGSLTIPLAPTWELQNIVGYRDVRSNYDLRRFDNVTGSLAVVKRF